MPANDAIVLPFFAWRVASCPRNIPTFSEYEFFSMKRNSVLDNRDFILFLVLCI
jgi:hypothetical protein